MNIACSICLESYTLTCNIYTTPCGHVFHYKCIRKWLESGNQHCPKCRQDCSIVEIVKLYFSENESALENNNLCTQLESENLKLQQEINALKARELGANQKCVALEEENKKLHTTFCQSRSNCASMDRVLEMQRREIYSKNQKIGELEAKCNQIAILAGSTGGSEGETGSSAGGNGSNPLAYLRNQEEFQQMKRILLQNPGILEALLQKIEQSNPDLLQMIKQDKCLKVDNTVQLDQEIVRTNRENTRDIVNEHLCNKPDQRSVQTHEMKLQTLGKLFESFGRPIMFMIGIISIHYMFFI